jgi:hypothetical protein
LNRLRFDIRRRLTALACCSLVLVQVACHTYLPLQDTVPDKGPIVAIVLNDRGRVQSGPRLGPGIRRVEGAVLRQSDSTITLGVTRTLTLEGTPTTWTGEEVVIARDGIAGFQARTFSRGRTIALVVGIILGVAALGGALGLDIPGFGGQQDGDGGCALCPEQ